MRKLTFILLLLTWWLTNNIFAIDTENLFNSFSNHHTIELTLFQTLLGIILSSLYLREPPKPVSLTPINLTISTLHFLGALLTNMSYAFIGSTSTLLWKLLEPLSAAVLKSLVLPETTSKTSFMALFIILSGVLHFSKRSFTIPSFSPIIFSTIVIPARNVFLKHSQNSHPTTPAKRFLQMLQNAFPLCIITTIAKLFFHRTNPAAIPSMLRNALLYNSYQLSSFLLLEALDPLTHSLLNTAKRFSAVLLSMFVTNVTIDATNVQGVLITFLGFCVYVTGGKTRNPVTVAAMASALMILAFLPFATLPTVEQVKLPAVEQVILPANTNYVVMLGHEYRLRRRNITYTGYEDAFGDDGGNVGNMVWQYGAHESLPDFRRVTICREDQKDGCADLAKVKGKRLVHYLPMANMMNPNSHGNFRTIGDAMERRGLEILVIGLGVQMEFREGLKPVFDSSARINVTVDNYVAPAMTKRFLELMEGRNQTMFFRGEFTLRVTQRAGYNRGFAVGCPSLFINRDIHLGRTLERKYRTLVSRIRDRTVKVAVNLKKVEGFEKQIVQFRDHYPFSRFFAQSGGDLQVLRRYNVSFERVRLLTNVEDWLKELRSMDMAYGVRIHGNLISLAAGLPVVVVATDWRVLEMVRAMRIPYVTSFDEVFEGELELAEVVEKVTFDGALFDRRRCEIAKVYVEEFGKFGIGVREHVKRISEIC